MKKKTIVVVCRGNVLRSPIVEVLMRREVTKLGIEKDYEIISRGVQGTKVDPTPTRYSNIAQYTKLFNNLRPLLDKYEVDLSGHKVTPIRLEDIKPADIVLVVDIETKESLEKLFPRYSDKLVLLSSLVGHNHGIDDPEKFDDLKKQQDIIEELQDLVLRGFPELIKRLG